MQEQVTDKVVGIVIKTPKLTAKVLANALKVVLGELKKKLEEPITYRGKQSIKHLAQQDATINNIEVTDGNIKAFQRTANKYGIDYAVKKDISESPPKYLVFFKGKDIDVLTQAFKEFTADTLHRDKKPSIRKTLSKHIEEVKTQHREKTREKNKNRGVER